MKYQIAEKFKSLQGEGLYAGTPMAFLRFTGCSVGKKICQHCDTVFERTLPWQGGGEFTEKDLLLWAYPYKHICLTGGEPLDQDLEELFKTNETVDMFHIETSGTKPLPSWMLSHRQIVPHRFWICVSPKPGFSETMITEADEVKVIVPGLGEINPKLAGHWVMSQDSPDTKTPDVLKHWPTLQDALRWADAGKLVYLQPRNGLYDVDKHNLMIVQDILQDHPNLRLSTQMHKILHVQ